MAASAFWHTTCAALQHGAEPGWDEVADYHRPLTLLLGARYAWLPSEHREDLVQEILVEIKERLYERYTPGSSSPW